MRPANQEIGSRVFLLMAVLHVKTEGYFGHPHCFWGVETCEYRKFFAHAMVVLIIR